jgi:hypothetical protein
MKKCFKCGSVKPITEFYVHRRMADGHLNKCKSCTKIGAIINRNSKIEYYREYDRDRYRNNEHRRALAFSCRDNKNSLRNVRYYAKHQERYSTKIITGAAIKSGILKKEKCFVCESANNVQAHHCDYSKPLDVYWLCTKCHAIVHAIQRTAERLGLKKFYERAA